MKVTFFITDISHSGGTERMTISLSNELVKVGYSVEIISLLGSGVPFYDCDDRIKFHVIMPQKKSLMVYYLFILFKLRNIIIANKSDFVVDVVTSMSLFSLPATLLTKAKVITWEHFNFSVDLGKKAMRIGRFLSTKFSYAIVVLTDADRRIYLDTYKCFARVITISNFLPEFPVTNKRNDTAGNIALAVGRITKQKGYDRLVEIWSDYLSIRPDTNWKLKIVGDGEDLSLIQDLIDFHHLGNSISILPPTKNIQIHYESASIFLLTSRWEGLPMVLIESQANGIPSIAYNCKTGPAEIITNGVNGFLIEDGDKVKFVEAIVELTESDEKRLTLSRNAKEMATNYSADKVVQKWINLFTS